MYKIDLEPKIGYNIFLTGDMIEWIFNNVTGKYLVDGKYIYFQKDGDAMAFKLKWL